MKRRREQPAEGFNEECIRVCVAAEGRAGFPLAGLALPSTFSDGTGLDVAALGLERVGGGLARIPHLEGVLADISRSTALAILYATEFDKYTRGEAVPKTLCVVGFATPSTDQWLREVATQGRMLLAVGDTAAWQRSTSDIDRTFILAEMAMGYTELAVYAYPTGIGFYPPSDSLEQR